MRFFIVLAAVVLLEAIIPTLKVTAPTIAVIPSAVSTVATTALPVSIAAVAVIAATATFPTEATTSWFEGQGFLVGNLNLWHVLRVLNCQVQDIEGQFFRAKFCSQLDRISLELVKAGPKFLIRKITLNLLEGHFFLGFKGFLSSGWLHTRHAFFGQVFNDGEVAHLIW